MIPYFIQEARPDEDCRVPNIYIQFNSCKKGQLNDTIIHCITSLMYEFCSNSYGHGIKINSYNDFCHQYWKINEIQIKCWHLVFRVYYFDNNDWIEWNIEDYMDRIYSAYLSRFPDE